MTRPDQHLSPDRIRQFAENKIIFQPIELQHLQGCDQCSDAWWKIRQELKRHKRGPNDTEKSA